VHRLKSYKPSGGKSKPLGFFIFKHQPSNSLVRHLAPDKMNLLCIDPGTTTSGVVIYDGKNILESYPEIDNEELIHNAGLMGLPDRMAIEMVACYGMPVGRETFETCVWIGRFIERFQGDYEFVYRKDVKLALCNSMRAKDANIRQAILDRFPATGGGKIPQVGIKKQPGPLYGVSRHSWSALAVGLTWFDMQRGVFK
jgi:hypothetical protein